LAERKLDIFVALDAINRHELDWLDKQPEDAQKEFRPPVVLRWASTVADGPAAEYYLHEMNEVVNLNLWNLNAYPDLVFRLMASCGPKLTGKDKPRHQWLGMAEKAAIGGKAKDLLARFHPSANDTELLMLLRLMSTEDFKAFVQIAGCTPDEEKEAIKAHARFKGEAVEEEANGKPKRRSKRAA